MDQWLQFQERLDATHEFPCFFTFKFIMPERVLEGFVAILSDHPYTTRESRGGRYKSITAEIFVDSSAEIIELYQAAARFEGVISL